MRVSTQTYQCERKLGAREAVRLICETGFDAIDYTMYDRKNALLSGDANPKEEIAELLRIASEYGAVFNQTHTPFPHYKEGEDSFNKEMSELVVRSLWASAELRAKYAIVHPIAFRGLSEEELISRNLEIFKPFFAEAERSGVIIAIENMWGKHPDRASRIVSNVCSTGDTHRRFIDAFREVHGERVCACLDIGHSGLVGDCADLAVRELGDRLSALHIQDNDFFTDMHTAPFFGRINFDRLTDALAEVNYKGELTFEADEFFVGMPIELYNPALLYLLASGRYLSDEIERKRAMLTKKQ